MNIRAVLSPAEIATLRDRDLSRATCVVFDVLRATSTMITALANGAEEILPVGEIEEALREAAGRPGALLAGEREGLRIGSRLTGGREFDFGNSPREFTPDRVRDRMIVMTTTNGTRAIRATRGAALTLVGSFLNLNATANRILMEKVEDLVLVASGTGSDPALEDTLGTGALIAALEQHGKVRCDDAAGAARLAWMAASENLALELSRAANARRLLEVPELAADVDVCLVRDAFAIAAGCRGDAGIRRL